MKIGLVLDDSLDSTDGVQQYVLTVGRWFSDQGHEVHYLVGETKRQDLKHLHSLGRNIRVRFNGNYLSIPRPASKARIQKLLAAENFDVLHVQMPYSPWLAGRIIKSSGHATAIVGTFHIAPYSSLAHAGTRLLGWWSRSSLKRFDRVVSVSSAAASFARQTFGLDTIVIPNAIDYQLFQSAKPIKKYQDSKLTILFLGRLVPRKGCQILLAAIAELLRQPAKVDGFRVLVCGKGPLEPRLRQFVKDQKLGEYVEFVGYVSEADKPNYYATADIAVFPSSGGESFGIVLAEAMSNGRTAVLAGDNAGYRSVMVDRPELLFAPEDVTGLATSLLQLLTDPQERQTAAVWGAEHARQYDREIVGKKLLAVYDEALRKQQ